MSVDFIDSNVFVYLFDRTDAHKRGTAERLIQRALEADTSAISHQVVQETLNVVTRKLRPAIGPDDARQLLHRVLVPLWRVLPSTVLYERGLDLQARHRISFYDALIIAAALETGCTRLYSEDLQHGQRIEGLTIDPFKE